MYMKNFTFHKKDFYKSDEYPNEVWLNKEIVIQLNLTSKCPLNCKFCYIKDKFKNKELSLHDIQKLWHNLRIYNKKYKIFYRVNLTGGDIFFYSKWKELCKFLAKENSVIAVDPLINRFWKGEHVDLLKILKDKISYIQMNLDVVTDLDIQIAKEFKKTVVLKFALYNGNQKRNLQKLKRLVKKFSNVVVGVDLIIPQKGKTVECFLGNWKKLRRDYFKLKRLFKERFWVLSTTLKREFEKEMYLCPVPFSGVYIMSDGKIVPCSRYPHLSTGFTIKNFDLIKYVKKFNLLVSNHCLFENKHFNKFWKVEENPINF